MLVTGPAEEVEEALEGHREHLRSLKAAHKLQSAGMFRHGDGFLDIFEAKDLLEAEGIARSSPLVEEGLATWMLREWSELEL
jgi:uncharacterized protein YciI